MFLYLLNVLDFVSDITFLSHLWQQVIMNIPQGLSGKRKMHYFLFLVEVTNKKLLVVSGSPFIASDDINWCL